MEESLIGREGEFFLSAHGLVEFPHVFFSLCSVLAFVEAEGVAYCSQITVPVFVVMNRLREVNAVGEGITEKSDGSEPTCFA